MDIKVLGTGCANCKNTIALIDQVAKAKGVTVNLEKVEELRAIMGYGVMSTPGVVINGKVVHAGGVPSRDKIEQDISPGVLMRDGRTDDFHHDLCDHAGKCGMG